MYLQALRKQLQSQDSLYSNFLKAAALRYKTGESRLLEKATAETQWNENKNLLRKNEADIRMAQTELQRLLNTRDSLIIDDQPFAKLTIGLAGTDSVYYNHPVNAWMKQQIAVNEQQVRVEKAKAGPDFSIGYFNQTIIGFQNVDGTEKYYGGGKRFQGVTAGIQIPLFNKPFAYRVKAARVGKQISESNYRLFQTNIQRQYQQAIQGLQKETLNVSYYEADALPNADLLLKQSVKSFREGEISYVEYLQALKTGSEIRLNYLQAIQQYNQAVITLQYLSGDHSSTN